jgi:hypothetical protein
MAKTTTRWGHGYPETGDAADVPKHIEGLAKSVDNVAMDDQGVIGSRPAAGKYGRYYYATDQGVLYRDTGTEWVSASPVRWYKPKIISTEESRENTSFGTLTTADKIEGVVVPENGIVVVLYKAHVKSSVAEAGKCAIFLGSNQLKTGASTAKQEASTKVGEANFYRYFSSYQGGLINNEIGVEPPVTTGQTIGHKTAGLGGFCPIEVAAGTYDISVQFKATSGSVTAKERKFWVYTLG